MRMIDGDALMNTLQKLFDKREKEQMFTGSREPCVTWNDAIYHIKSAPTVDAVPVVRGKWIKQEPYNQNYWKCSHCGETNKYAYRDGDVTIYELQDFFCPNCGADMRGEENDAAD